MQLGADALLGEDLLEEVATLRALFRARIEAERVVLDAYLLVEREAVLRVDFAVDLVAGGRRVRKVVRELLELGDVDARPRPLEVLLVERDEGGVLGAAEGEGRCGAGGSARRRDGDLLGGGAAATARLLEAECGTRIISVRVVFLVADVVVRVEVRDQGIE